MFEAMQAKYPNLNLPIPAGVVSGTQRATRSLTRKVNAAAVAEETEDGDVDTEAIDTADQQTADTADTDEGAEAQGKGTDQDPPSTPAPGRKATSRKRSTKSKRKSSAKKVKSEVAEDVTEAEDATVVDVNYGQDEDEEDIVSIELTLYSSGRLSDLVSVFPPCDRTYQHDPLMPSMRPVSSKHRLPVTRALFIIKLDGFNVKETFTAAAVVSCPKT